MSKLNYTIVIPHKNSPQYLNRCLNSIPYRDDIEIIVIDDDSDNEKKPIISRENVQLILLDRKHCKGAGRARNVGVNRAKGKWLLFADCDDYYVNGFLEELDKYVDTNYDVIYFNFNQFHEGKEEPVKEKISNYIKECSEGKRDVDYVKYRNNVPWNKMIRRDFVEKNTIKFEEISVANDMFFSFQVGFFSHSYTVIDKKLYNYIVYQKSQTNKDWNEEKIETFLENLQKYNGFMEFVNHKDWTHGLIFLIYQLYRRKVLNVSIKLLHFYFLHKQRIDECKEKYPLILKSKFNNGIVNNSSR